MGKVYYSQRDNRWGNHWYLYNSVFNSGCGPTSAAMVVSSLTNTTVYPDEMADYAVKIGARFENAGTDGTILFPKVAQKYGLNGTLSYDINTAIQCVQNGGMVALSVNGGSIFSTGGHLLCMVGASADGNTLEFYDPFLYSGKFNSSFRANKVRVDGNSVYVSKSNILNYGRVNYYYCFTSTEGITTSTPTDPTIVAAGSIDPNIYDIYEQAIPIWVFLKECGYPNISIAALMGNMYGESSLYSKTKQNDYTRAKQPSLDYTNAMSSQRSRFINDEIGYGLCQWTFSSRKQHLYDDSGGDIGNLGKQLQYLQRELRNDSDLQLGFKINFQEYLMNQNDNSNLSTVVKKIQDIFLSPRGDDVGKRTTAAQFYYNTLSNMDLSSYNYKAISNSTNYADSMIYRNSNPPKYFQIKSPVYGMDNRFENKVQGIIWHSVNRGGNPRLANFLEIDNSSMADLGTPDYLAAEKPVIDAHAYVGKNAKGKIASVLTLPVEMIGLGLGPGKSANTRAAANRGWLQLNICEDDWRKEGNKGPLQGSNRDYFDQIYEEACQLTAYWCEQNHINPLETFDFEYSGQIIHNVPRIICHADTVRLMFEGTTSQADIYHWFSRAQGVWGTDIDFIPSIYTNIEISKNDTNYKNWINQISKESSIMQNIRQHVYDIMCGTAEPIGQGAAFIPYVTTPVTNKTIQTKKININKIHSGKNYIQVNYCEVGKNSNNKNFATINCEIKDLEQEIPISGEGYTGKLHSPKFYWNRLTDRMNQRQINLTYDNEVAYNTNLPQKRTMTVQLTVIYEASIDAEEDVIVEVPESERSFQNTIDVSVYIRPEYFTNWNNLNKDVIIQSQNGLTATSVNMWVDRLKEWLIWQSQDENILTNENFDKYFVPYELSNNSWNQSPKGLKVNSGDYIYAKWYNNCIAQCKTEGKDYLQPVIDGSVFSGNGSVITAQHFLNLARAINEDAVKKFNQK